jgi:GNAT superfamily N-acetyltransferase
VEISIRQATLDDIPEIVRQRRGMYQDMGYSDGDALEKMVSVCALYLAQAIHEHSFRGWLGLNETRVIGGGGIIFSPWLSHPYDLQCRRATILNVYVYPDFRRRGVARRLMETMIEWCRDEKFAAVYLHSSNDGRHLYESLGFAPTTEMQLHLQS